MAKLKILQLDGKWVPKFVAESRKQAIRDARSMRSAASKAELAWMLANPDKATKVYKSGTREFGGEANKLRLLKTRLEAMKPYLTLKNRLLGGADLVGDAGKGTLKLIKSHPKIAASIGAGSVLVGIPAYNILTGKIYDNVFPYGYLDKKAGDKYTEEDWGERFKKFIPAAYGFKSDARKHFDMIAAADLSDPKLREEALKIYESDPVLLYPMGKASLEYVLNRFRNRTDFNDLYLGRPQTYNTLIPNKEYTSAKSKEDPKVITYTIADPEVRNMLRSQGRDFNLSGDQSEIDSKKGYGLLAVSDHNGIFGDFSIIKNLKNGAGKYIEKWDYPLSDITNGLGLTKEVIIADTIPGNQPRLKYRFGTHHNRSLM